MDGGRQRAAQPRRNPKQITAMNPAFDHLHGLTRRHFLQSCQVPGPPMLAALTQPRVPRRPGLRIRAHPMAGHRGPPPACGLLPAFSSAAARRPHRLTRGGIPARKPPMLAALTQPRVPRRPGLRIRAHPMARPPRSTTRLRAVAHREREPQGGAHASPRLHTLLRASLRKADSNADQSAHHPMLGQGLRPRCRPVTRPSRDRPVTRPFAGQTCDPPLRGTDL